MCARRPSSDIGANEVDGHVLLGASSLLHEDAQPFEFAQDVCDGKEPEAGGDDARLDHCVLGPTEPAELPQMRTAHHLGEHLRPPLSAHGQ